jgi:hypothetical protein
MARNTAAEKPREYVGCALSEVQRKKGDGKAAARKAVETQASLPSVFDPNCGAAEISRDRTYELFDVRKKTAGFLTYHGFLTIASSSRIISLDRLVFLIIVHPPSSNGYKIDGTKLTVPDGTTVP